MQDQDHWCTVNYKIFLGQMKEKLNKYRDIPYLWAERLNVKISILLKLMCRFKAILTNIPAAFFNRS